MNQKKMRLLLVLSAIALIGMIFILIYSLFGGGTDMGNQAHSGFCPRMIPNYFLWISMILVVAIVFPISYYFISKNLEEKKERNLNAIKKLVDSNIKEESNQDHNNNISILKLLNKNEAMVMNKLINKEQPILQSEISRMDGMTKLKSHRTVKELLNKGLIKLEAHGKTNKIRINDDVKELFTKMKD